MGDISIRHWLSLLDAKTIACAETRRALLVNVCRDLGRDFNFELASQLVETARRELENAQFDAVRFLAEMKAAANESKTAEYVLLTLKAEYLPSRRDENARDAEYLARLTTFERSLRETDAALLLKKARLAVRIGEEYEAYKTLQRALLARSTHALYVKSQSLVTQALTTFPRDFFQRSLRLAVVGSCSTRLLVPALKAAGLARGIRFEIYEAPYNNYCQEIFDENSELYRFEPDVLFMLLESRELNPGPIFSREAADEYVARVRKLRDVWRGRSSAPIVQTALDYPLANSWGGLEDVCADGRRRQIDRINAELSTDLPEGISMIFPTQLAPMVDGPWATERDWYVSKQYPSPNALPVLADAATARIAATFGLAKKALVLDLDDTLWGGVVGEDGVDGIHIGPSTPQGESYAALQQYAKELQQKGILLAVCSKNNEKDALLPFEKRSDMILKRDDFAAFYANWNEKDENLVAIAEDLGLGLDSLVFLDDNPLERAAVRAVLPQVVVPEFDSAHWRVVSTLRRSMLFETTALTAEDVGRHESYRARAKAGLSRAASGDEMNDILRALEMVAQCEPVNEYNLTRVSQLSNKSNQFNLTSRRYSVDDARRRAFSKNWWCRAFHLRDKHGNHGLVGILFVEISGERWIIDEFATSCRVIGRRLEEAMLATLFSAAKERGARVVEGRCVATPRNTLVAELFPKFGFDQTPTKGVWTRRVADGFVVANPVVALEETPLRDEIASA